MLACSPGSPHLTRWPWSLDLPRRVRAEAVLASWPRRRWARGDPDLPGSRAWGGGKCCINLGELPWGPAKGESFPNRGAMGADTRSAGPRVLRLCGAHAWQLLAPSVSFLHGSTSLL